jgi:hypothetical protein
MFSPIGHAEYRICAADSIRYFCVPTEMVGDTALQGVVHDPLARLQGGISAMRIVFHSSGSLAFCTDGLERRGTR